MRWFIGFVLFNNEAEYISFRNNIVDDRKYLRECGFSGNCYFYKSNSKWFIFFAKINNDLFLSDKLSFDSYLSRSFQYYVLCDSKEHNEFYAKLLELTDFKSV